MTNTNRPSGRDFDQLRDVTLETGVTRYAEGSCLAKFGHTHVLCTASWTDKVPPWMRGRGSGWVTGEYGMLPRATHTRGRREATAGKQSGRTQEIQRLIGRSLRSVVDLKALGMSAANVKLTDLFAGEEAKPIRTTAKALKAGLALEVDYPDGHIFLVERR